MCSRIVLRKPPLPHGETRVKFAYDEFKADRVIAEINFGGAMVEFVLKTAAPYLPVTIVTASRGKTQRAEPIAALYEQGRVSHVGNKKNQSVEFPNDLAAQHADQRRIAGRRGDDGSRTTRRRSERRGNVHALDIRDMAATCNVGVCASYCYHVVMIASGLYLADILIRWSAARRSLNQRPPTQA
jgi:hypothetical protein